MTKHRRRAARHPRHRAAAGHRADGAVRRRGLLVRAAVHAARPRCRAVRAGRGGAVPRERPILVHHRRGDPRTAAFSARAPHRRTRLDRHRPRVRELSTLADRSGTPPAGAGNHKEKREKCRSTASSVPWRRGSRGVEDSGRPGVRSGLLRAHRPCRGHWNTDYEALHLITSRSLSGYDDYPMPEHWPTPPGISSWSSTTAMPIASACASGSPSAQRSRTSRRPRATTASAGGRDIRGRQQSRL